MWGVNSVRMFTSCPHVLPTPALVQAREMYTNWSLLLLQQHKARNIIVSLQKIWTHHPCYLRSSKTHITVLMQNQNLRYPSKEQKYRPHLLLHHPKMMFPTYASNIQFWMDFGSQTTYCWGGVLERLGVGIKTPPRHINTIKTFLGKETRTIHSLDLDMNFCCDSFFKVLALFDPSLNNGFEVKDLIVADYDLRQHGYDIADHFYYKGKHGNIVNNIDILLWNDSLYLMKHFIVVNCIKGNAIEFCHGFIPFGTDRSFSTFLSQIKIIYG